MADQDEHRERRGQLRAALPEIIGSGVAGGLAAGGLDPVAAATVAPTLAAVMRLDEWSMGRRFARGEQVIAMTAERLGAAELLEELATADDPRLELTARVLEAAARTTLADKVRALSRVLANGLDSPALVDEAMFLTRALDDIEAPHLQVLALLNSKPSGPTMLDYPDNPVGWTTDEILAELPGLRLVLVPVLQVLQLRGVVVDTSIDGGTADGRDSTRRTPTDLGRRCLELLEKTPT